MGGLGRVPGPTGGGVPSPVSKLLGFLSNLDVTVDCKEPNDPAHSKDSKDSSVLVSHIKSEVLDVMNRIYYPGGGGDFLPGEASIRDPTPAALPIFREGDSRRDVKTPGVSLTSKCFKMKPQDFKWSKDAQTLDISADGRATLEIPTPFPRTFDTPTDIPIRLTLTQLGAKDLSVSGYAKAYKVVTARYKLTLHWDPRLLLRKLVQMAKDQNVKQADVEEMLSHMSFDFSSTIKAGRLPLAVIKMAASSLLPLKHPLIGSTDDLIPVQVAALPDHRLFMG
jgi:hypothetical protein